MNAGRELDYLIQEQIFEKCAHRNESHYTCQGDSGFECSDCGAELYGKRCPKYSTDIAAAMDVLELLRKKYFHVQINVFSDLVNVIIWQDDITPLFDAEAESIQMAISLVALKTKGIEVGEERRGGSEIHT